MTKKLSIGDPVYLKPDGKVQVGVDHGDGTMVVIGQVQSLNVPNRNGDVYVKPIKEIGTIDPKAFARGKKGVAGKLINFKLHVDIGVGMGNVGAINRLRLFNDPEGFPETLFDNLTRRKPWSMTGLERVFEDWHYR